MILLERNAEERRRRGVTFRELVHEYLCWLDDIKGAKPSTLCHHRCLLAEPGQPYRRGRGSSPGLILAALGDRPAREVTTREVEDLLRAIAATGVAPRTVNKARQLICAIFNYGMRPSTYGLHANPAQHADRRREPDAAPLVFYSPEQVEALARALADGAHRDPSRPALSPTEIEARAHEDAQDAELVRVAAYAGLRRGELVALRRRGCRFPRSQDHRSPRAVRRDGGPLNQEPPSAAGATSRSGRSGAGAAQPPRRIHRAR